MIWLDNELKSPLSGVKLKIDSAHSLTDGAARFPVVENIPFLRSGRDDLCAQVLNRLDAGDKQSALVLLLQDRDDWASGEPPTAHDLQPLFDGENLNLREAMKCLKYGAVADYFAYRWSDPTFLSGLALLENHLPASADNVFELCCGIGHYLREFDLRSIAATGADVVFSKLWLARKFVAPNAKLICFDANYDFPFAQNAFDAAFCHDAFYFLPQKPRVASELKRTTSGAILIGHAHNSEAANFSSGAAVSVKEYAAMFENATLYDDAELTAALIENREPAAQTIEELKTVEAINVAYQTKGKSEIEPENGGQWMQSFVMPTARRKVQLNPLLIDTKGCTETKPLFPTERYKSEYAKLSTYLYLSESEVEKLKSIRRETGDGWTSDAKFLNFLRRRVLLDLPENW